MEVLVLDARDLRDEVLPQEVVDVLSHFFCGIACRDNVGGLAAEVV